MSENERKRRGIEGEEDEKVEEVRKRWGGAWAWRVWVGGCDSKSEGKRREAGD